jgi:hypothetical protein
MELATNMSATSSDTSNNNNNNNNTSGSLVVQASKTMSSMAAVAKVVVKNQRAEKSSAGSGSGSSGKSTRWDSLRQSIMADTSTMKYETENLEAALDPLKIGDELVLGAKVLNMKGFLHGDLASNRVGVQQSDVSFVCFVFTYIYIYIYV